MHNNIKQTCLKMTVFPAVIFAVAFILVKSGVLTPSFLDNEAKASGYTAPLDATAGNSLDIISYIQDWRSSKIVRTSLSYDPQMFEDLSIADIEKLFGTPDLERADGQARVAQYTHNGCVADFYYLSGGNGDIQHYEIRQTEEASSTDCLYDLLQNL